MPSNVNANIYVTGLAVDKTALNANLQVIKDEIEALQNAGPATTPAALATAFDTLLGGPDWRGRTLSHGGFSAPTSNYDPAADSGQHALIDVNTNAVNIVLPDTGSYPDGIGFFATVNSNANLASISALIPNQMRSTPFVFDPDFNQDADQIFVGTSQADQRNALVYVHKKSSVWRVLGHIRGAAIDNASIIKASQLDPSIGRYGSDNLRPTDGYTLLQSDADEFLLSTGGSSWDIPLLAPGSQFIIKRADTSPLTLNAIGGAQFDRENVAANADAIQPGKTITLVMRPGSSLIDVFGGS